MHRQYNPRIRRTRACCRGMGLGLMAMGQDLRAVLENAVPKPFMSLRSVFFDACRDLPAREANIACRAGPTRGRWVGGRSGRRGERCLGGLGLQEESAR